MEWTHHHVKESIITTAAHCGQHRHEEPVYLTAQLLIPVGMWQAIAARVDNPSKAANEHKDISLASGYDQLFPVHQLGHGKGGLNLQRKR